MGEYNQIPHSHSHHHGTKNIRAAFFLNLLFTIIEVVGGVYTNSIAILSDALHDLGDTITLGLSWYFQKISQRERDDHFSYGYGRFSVFGALVAAVVLFAGSIFIILESIPRLINPVQPETTGMIWLAIVGIVMNGIAVLRLRKGSSLNERVIYLHLIEDVLGWVTVLIGSIIMHFYDFPIIDPILSLSIAGWILFNVAKNVRQAAKILLQGTPMHVDTDGIMAAVSKIDGVLGVHDCHAWTMDGEYNIVTLDIEADANTTLKEQESIKAKVWEIMKSFNVEHVTIEFDSGVNTFNHPEEHT